MRSLSVRSADCGENHNSTSSRKIIPSAEHDLACHIFQGRNRHRFARARPIFAALPASPSSVHLHAIGQHDYGTGIFQNIPDDIIREALAVSSLSSRNRILSGGPMPQFRYVGRPRNSGELIGRRGQTRVAVMWCGRIE